MTPRRIVVVPYYYPPFPGAGNRWPSMARYLCRAGHSVTIVATAAFGSLPDDDELGVVRVPDLRSVPALRRLLRRGELPTAGAAWVETPPTRLLTRVVVPDAYAVSWLPAALFAVRRLIRAGDVDCLVTSSPPESTHLIGLLLGRRRPAWIAELRDGWLFEPLRDAFPTAPQRALDAWLERRVARSAEVVVGATRPIVDDATRRLGAYARWVTNGFDPQEIDEKTGGIPTGSDAVWLIYTGTLRIRGFDPEPFLKALLRVRGEGVDVRLRVAGNVTQEDSDLLERLGVGPGTVDRMGLVSRRAAIGLQREGDALLLVSARDRSIATSKVFEYLGAGRPIVALAERNEAERIVRETNTGITVPSDDIDAIAEALRKVASGELAAGYAPLGVEQFTYPAPAEEMAALIESAIARRVAKRR